MGAAIEVGMSAEVAHGDGRDLADELDRLEALGCDLAEIPLIALCVMAGGRILPGPTSRLVAACAGRPLAYSVHAAIGLNFMGEPEHLRLQFDVAVASLDVAARIGARHVVMHTGFCRADAPDIEDRYARQREWLARLGLEAQARDCTICVENIFPFEPDHHTAAPSRLAREIAAIGHEHVRATLDVSHGFLHAGACGGDPLAEALALARVSRHVHLHDSFGRPEETFWAYSQAERVAFGLGDLHLPLGWGAIPFDALMREARFEPGTAFVIELPSSFGEEAAQTLEAARALASVASRED